jgi:hypothetical protein
MDKWVDFKWNLAQFYFQKWTHPDFRPNIPVFQHSNLDIGR